MVSPIHLRSGVLSNSWVSTRWRFTGKWKLYSYIFFASSCLFITYCYITTCNRTTYRTNFNFSAKEAGERAEPKTKSRYLIDQPGCRIPSMSVLGPLVDPYMPKERPPPLHCEYGPDERGYVNLDENAPLKPAIIVDDETSLRIDLSILAQYYNKTNVICNYRRFNRPPDDSDARYIDHVIIYSEDVNWFNSSHPTITVSDEDEFVSVNCMDASEMSANPNVEPFYTDYFAFTPIKKAVEDRCKRIDDRKINRDRINVMLMGLDAVSRLNFQRQMTVSYKYLTQEMRAIEMYGYNKLADNTFPNIIPLLSGLFHYELKEYCWNSWSDTFDRCPFIWNVYRFHGYRTIFAEDGNPISSIFSYLFRGFHNQPTDYYLHPFYRGAQREIGFNHCGECDTCLGARISIKVFMRYAIKHIRTWKRDQPFFGFFFSSCYTHDNFSLNAEGDNTLMEFLENFRQNEISNNTILIMFSDHGLRYGDFRWSYQGRLEERLPLLMFALPDWFERKYPLAIRNLRYNQNMLSTHFDLSETLLDLADLQRISDETIIARQKHMVPMRSRSLLLPIDATRTCDIAGIPKSYCTCHDEVRELNVTDDRAIDAANALVKHINNLVKSRTECAQFTLDKIEKAAMESSNMGRSITGNIELMISFVITVRLTPGGGLFEGTTNYNDSAKTYEVIGEVNRINLYGSQSACIKDNLRLKLYCFCT